MRRFNNFDIKKWNFVLETLNLIASIYKETGKQELYLKQCPEKLGKLVEIALGL